MWVEEDDTGHRAHMLCFYPKLGSDALHGSAFISPGDNEVVLLLDCSSSMRGNPIRTATGLANALLDKLPFGVRFNVVCFGSAADQLFLTSKPANKLSISEAKACVANVKASFGGSDAWRPLKNLFWVGNQRSDTPRTVVLVTVKATNTTTTTPTAPNE